MHDSWLRFSPHIEQPARRSLSLAFILEELLKSSKNYDCLSYYCEMLTNEDSLQKEILKMKIEKLHGFPEQIHSFFCALLPFLFQSRTDENLLIKLLELKDRLNEKLGPYTVEKLLASFSPNGITHIKTLIAEGLTRRCFTSFLEEKEYLFDRLELCQSTLV